MNLVSILTTNEAVARSADFVHGDVVFRFDLLRSTGPSRPVEGDTWVFVDWVLNDLSGLEMCRRLRSDPRMQDAHVTMVLEWDDGEHRRRALLAGADDYIVGAPDRQVILDRVLALYATRRQCSPAPQIDLGDLQINVAGEQALWRGKLIPLRPHEFRVLRFMSENPNRVLSRQELLDALGRADQPYELRTADVWIRRLRCGLSKAGAGALLRTVRGKGYVLDLL